MAKYGRGFGCFAEGAYDPAGGTDLPMEEDGTKAGMELLSLQEEPLGLNRDNLRRVRKRKRALAHKLPPKPPPPFCPPPPTRPPLLRRLHRISMEAAPATMATRGQSHAPNPGAHSQSAAFQAHVHQLPDWLFTYICTGAH